MMTPIHKSGNLHCVDNYRGISILCSISKVFEKMVHEVLFRAARSLLSEVFVQHRSTTTNLMCYTSSLFREVDNKNQVDSIYADFSEAFDVVPHDFAIEKLKHIGFPVYITDWLHSYLTNRNAFTQVNFARSRYFTIPSGVPQGSVLGPLIFILLVRFKSSSPLHQ